VVRAVGLASQVLLIYPFIHAFCRVRVTGLDRLDGVHGPVLFTPNHCLHLDNAIILTRLPLGVRSKLSVAAGAETIHENPLQGVLASVVANAFPLARESWVRKSLELLGARLDRVFNILIYPEGKLTVGGPLQPFKAGRRPDRRRRRDANRAGQDQHPFPCRGSIAVAGRRPFVVTSSSWWRAAALRCRHRSRGSHDPALEAAVAAL